MNLVDRLMQLDAGKLALPTKQIEIKRLSKLTGAPFVVTCQALDPETHADIVQMTTRIDKKGRADVNTSEAQGLFLVEGITDPDLKNKALLEHFKVHTPAALVQKLFLPGEIIELAEVIASLSGFGDSSAEEEEIKNS